MFGKYRIEIYDDVKSHDLTIYSETNVNREDLSYMVYSNIRQFSGKVRAYAVDVKTKKKVAAMFLNEEIVNYAKSKTNGIKKMELGL
jgi:hypothetical protein